MTLKFEGNGLKFGRTWVDRIMGKVDKDQGVANAGKVLGIGSDGIVTPVEQTGGGEAFTPWTETISASKIKAKIINGEIKIGDLVEVTLPYATYAFTNVTLKNIGSVEAPLYRFKYGSYNQNYQLFQCTCIVRSVDTSTGKMYLNNLFYPNITRPSWSAIIENTDTTVSVEGCVLSIVGSLSTTDSGSLNYSMRSIVEIIATDTILGEVVIHRSIGSTVSTEFKVTHMS